LIRQAQDREIELAYVDEAGFSLAPPVRSAWTLRGKTHKAEPQKSGRLNVMGALFSSGGLYLSGTWSTMTALTFAGFLSRLLLQTSKPLVVVVDNASIHAAKAVNALFRLPEFKRLTLYFLPPYSPELNRIEILWRKIKYEWLPFRKHTRSELVDALDGIQAGFGKEYNLTFC
jgi:transposase